jgi:hypothetical protein
MFPRSRSLMVEVGILLIVFPQKLSWTSEHSTNLIPWAAGNGSLFTTLWWPIVTLRFVLLTASLPSLSYPRTRDDRGPLQLSCSSSASFITGNH